MKYAIFIWKNETVWALIIRENKNGTYRVKISNNWKETITPNKIINSDELQIMLDNKSI